MPTPRWQPTRGEPQGQGTQAVPPQVCGSPVVVVIVSAADCSLALIVNGEAVSDAEAQEVLDLVHEWACPAGPIVADFALDRPTSARVVVGWIAQALLPTRLALL
jgi:hypothetical protein